MKDLTTRRLSLSLSLPLSFSLSLALSCSTLLLGACPKAAPETTTTTTTPVPPSADQAGIEKWAPQYAQGSKDLGDWVRSDPQGAAKVFRWDGRHPDQTHELVTWAIANPERHLDAFAAHHPDWLVVPDLVSHHGAAMEAFLAWCHNHPEDATALMNYPRALEWAGHNLYPGLSTRPAQ